MAGEWHVKTLDQLGRVVTGKTPPSTILDAFGGHIPFVTPSDMDGARIISNTTRHLSVSGQAAVKNAAIPKGAVMVSCIGSDMGKAAIAGADCATNQQINSIIIDTDDSPLFVYYNLSSRKSEIRGSASGSAQPILNKSAFGRLEIELPSPAEQRAIAHILGTLDDKIELNRRRNQTLEAMARALFKDWFVDFGPVRAKMEGREPYLPADLWQLFPDRLDDEGKPEGWRSATLANFASLNPESWTKKNPPHEIRYVDLSNTKQGTIEGAARMPWSEAPSRAQRILRTGDTIVGTVRPGNESFALISDEGMTGSTGFAVLRPQEKHFRDFVFLAATSPENIERLTHLADGAAYPAVRPAVVLASPVTIPAEETVNDVLRGFANAVSNWVDAIEKNKQESRTLAQLRDTLLPKLISGELRITDAEKFLERAEDNVPNKKRSLA